MRAPGEGGDHSVVADVVADPVVFTDVDEHLFHLGVNMNRLGIWIDALTLIPFSSRPVIWKKVAASPSSVAAKADPT